MPGTLHCGDNLDVLRRHIADESIDLVYLDPPFKSNQDYAVHVGAPNTRTAPVPAFADTWTWDAATTATYEKVIAVGGGVARALVTLRDLLGPTDMLAYLAMMAPRLVDLRRVLKPTGSLYLHCDPTASHYLKIVMDAVFGRAGFRNEIVWCYRKWSVAARQFARNHDVIHFYSKAHDGTHVFDPLHVPVSAGTRKRWKGRRQHAHFEDGVRKARSVAGSTSRSPMPDWWDLSIINPNAAERLDYPTQKPEALLERIVQASSREGDVVLDPCCGSGTTLVVAERLGRAWIGIDVSRLAVELAARRLRDRFGTRALQVTGTQTTRVARRAAISAGT
ncbi:MAG: site-specific DNA-methyltransferase [Deltaproteobacteria bacterium]|nr:site-specific DNA-methyltransferase [Deltaproteobacteria bacterium]